MVTITLEPQILKTKLPDGYKELHVIGTNKAAKARRFLPLAINIFLMPMIPGTLALYIMQGNPDIVWIVLMGVGILLLMANTIQIVKKINKDKNYDRARDYGVPRVFKMTHTEVEERKTTQRRMVVNVQVCYFSNGETNLTCDIRTLFKPFVHDLNYNADFEFYEYDGEWYTSFEDLGHKLNAPLEEKRRIIISDDKMSIF